MERYSPHQNGRKQQSAQHEKKATEFLQAKVNVSASIFSSQSAIEHMKKHLGREKRRSWVNMPNPGYGSHLYTCIYFTALALGATIRICEFTASQLYRANTYCTVSRHNQICNYVYSTYRWKCFSPIEFEMTKKAVTRSHVMHVSWAAHVTWCHAAQPPLQGLQPGDVVGERSVGVVVLQVGTGERSVVSRHVKPAR